MFDNALRHIEVWREAWKAEREERKLRRPIHEKDFLPAALEIMEKPPSPVGRGLLWVILGFFIITIGWSIIGKVDEVAITQGRLVPREQVKLVQPIDAGVVRAIHVENGVRVSAGDILIELDPTFTGADEEQAVRQLRVASMLAARAQTLLGYLENPEQEWLFEPPYELTARELLTQRQLIRARIGEYNAGRSSLDEQELQVWAELRTVKQEILKIEETLPLVKEQLAARKELLDKGLSPRMLYLELKEREVTQRQNLAIQLEQRNRVQANIRNISKQIERLTQEFMLAASEEFAEAKDQQAMASAEIDKASKRRTLQTLRAPVDGVVQQLNVHTIGGVVEPAKPLMVIVPGGGELIVEAMLLNKDIGFVNEGDNVEVKLEAFPFTKYGVIDGIIENISLDAIKDEDMGLVYAVRVGLKKQDIMVRGRKVRLSPGMVASAEVKTGKKRIIEFIISPLLRYRDESMRER